MNGERPRDAIYATALDQLADFRFDERVAAVFPDMINRSVPGYGTVIAMLEPLARRFAQPASRVYDLGCSLGAATLSLRRGLDDTDCTIVGVDNSDAMLSRCRDYLKDDPHSAPVSLVCEDIRSVPLDDACIVALIFTLQFVPPGERTALLQRIYDGLLPGGVLILAEKIGFAKAAEQELMTDLHHGFKRAKGYSDLEISQKRSALENVLIPETEAVHRERLLGVGFSSVDRWFQCLNFAAWLAIK